MDSGTSWLRIWIMLAALSSVASVAFAGGAGYVIIVATVGIISGHVYSLYRRGHTSRLPLLAVALLLLVVVILTRHDFRLVLSGAILPLAHLFLMGQALGSFELRGRSSLYRSLVISGFTVLIASEAAVSLSYLLTLGAFVLSAMAAVATANLEDQTTGSTCVPSGKRFSSAPFWAGSAVAFLVLSGLFVWAFPRFSILSQAAPSYLPSRMEVAGDLSLALPSEPSAATSIMPEEAAVEGLVQAAEQVHAVSQEGDAMPQANGKETTDLSLGDAKGPPKPSEASGQEATGPFQVDNEGTTLESSAKTLQATRQGTTQGLNVVLADLGWGSAGDEVVMNVRSPVASYWRGLVLDRYDGTTWSPSPNRPSLGIEDMEGTGSHRLREVLYWQTYYVQTDAPIPLFSGYIPERVVLPESAMRVSQEEAGPARFLFSKSVPYRALSWVPNLNPDALRRDVALHRDPAYLALPQVSGRVRALAGELARGGATDFDKAVRLEQFLRRNYEYGQDGYSPGSSEETTDIFLFQRKIGTCSEFASAMAVMARLAGLPARIAIGYRPGTYDLWSGTYKVRAGDAHAWVEIHFRDHGWVPFDPTPSSQKQVSALSLPRWNALPDWQQGRFALSMNSPGAAAFSRLAAFGGWGKTGVRPLAIFPLALVLVAGGVLGVRRVRRRSKPGDECFEYSQLRDPQRQRMINLFKRVEAALAKSGFRRRWPTETIAEYGRAAGGLFSTHQEPIERLAEIASRAAYDPHPFSKDLVSEAVRRAEHITRSGAGGLRRTQAGE